MGAILRGRVRVHSKVRKGRRRYGERRGKKKGSGEIGVGNHDLDEVEGVEWVRVGVR